VVSFRLRTQHTERDRVDFLIVLMLYRVIKISKVAASLDGLLEDKENNDESSRSTQLSYGSSSVTNRNSPVLP